MVNVNKMHANETIKKKKVTFSICTDKSDCDTKIPKEAQHGEPKLLNCASKSNEFHHSPPIITYNKSGVLSQPTKCVGKFCDVKKTLVRNVEQAIQPHCMLVKKNTTPLSVNLYSTGEKLMMRTNQPYKSKYAAPELYTTLCLAKEIQITSNRIEIKKPSIPEVPQAAKKILDEKILSRLNFPLEEKLYKDLISLNVCEGDFLGGEDKVGTRKEVEFRLPKDSEPKLSDFYTPSKGREYLVIPETPPPKIEKKRKYNGFTLYERSQIWNSLQGRT